MMNLLEAPHLEAVVMYLPLDTSTGVSSLLP